VDFSVSFFAIFFQTGCSRAVHEGEWGCEGPSTVRMGCRRIGIFPAGKVSRIRNTPLAACLILRAPRYEGKAGSPGLPPVRFQIWFFWG
jgi:hypothetical protein